MKCEWMAAGGKPNWAHSHITHTIHEYRPNRGKPPPPTHAQIAYYLSLVKLTCMAFRMTISKFIYRNRSLPGLHILFIGINWISFRFCQWQNLYGAFSIYRLVRSVRVYCACGGIRPREWMATQSAAMTRVTRERQHNRSRRTGI